MSLILPRSPWVEVDKHLVRGPQPDLEALRNLRSVGLTGVISLRAEGSYGQPPYGQSDAISLGLAWHRIPVEDWGTPSVAQVNEFLDLLAVKRDSNKWLVHCLGGVGRTGVFVACYRIARGWTAEEAIKHNGIEVPWLGKNDQQIAFVLEFARQFYEAYR